MKKISLIGFGKMGKAIKSLCNEYGFELENIITRIDNLEKFKGDICIDFTTPEAFIKNYKIISQNFKNIIIGTTGWYDSKNEILNYFKTNKNNVIYGSNFSIGVNIFFLISEYAAYCLKDYPEYSVYISEKHHKEKKDKPSGTAITLNNLISQYKNVDDISSVRSGKIKGIHEVEFISEIDSIKLEHSAYTRDGFAKGALEAAKWIQDINGIFEFKEIIKNKIIKKL